MSEDELEPLVTQCPHCGTRFRVTETQLVSAGGKVRCGACLAVFHGAAGLVIAEGETDGTGVSEALDTILAELASGPPRYPASVSRSGPDPVAPPAGTESAGPPLEGEWLPPEATGEDVAGGDPEPAVKAPAVADLMLGAYAEGLADGRRPRRRPWLAWVAVAGVLALVGQLMWYQKDALAANPAIRPHLEWVCGYLGCRLPVYREPGAIQARELVVRAHPETPNALVVDALVVNLAALAQPYPVIELIFSDPNGRIVARRGFKPAEYLGGELTGSTRFMPSTPIHISLAIEDPGDAAVNYRMTFR